MLYRIWIELRSIPEKFIYLVFKLYILKWSVHICSKNIFISWWGYCFSFSFIMFTNTIIRLFYLLHWCENVIIIKLYGKYFFSLQEVTSFWNCWKGQILNNWKQIKFWHFLSWLKNWKVHAGEMHHSHLWVNKKHTKFTNKNKTNKKMQIQSVQTKMQIIRKKENWKEHVLGVDTKLQKSG